MGLLVVLSLAISDILSLDFLVGLSSGFVGAFQGFSTMSNFFAFDLEKDPSDLALSPKFASTDTFTPALSHQMTFTSAEAAFGLTSASTLVGNNTHFNGFDSLSAGIFARVDRA